MLRQHDFYVYYSGDKVLARMGTRSPKVIFKATSPQEAHDIVQTIINPDAKSHVEFGPTGYHSEEFQSQISANCEKVVREAYGISEGL